MEPSFIKGSAEPSSRSNSASDFRLAPHPNYSEPLATFIDLHQVSCGRNHFSAVVQDLLLAARPRAPSRPIADVAEPREAE